jgi:hypothetical protein
VLRRGLRKKDTSRLGLGRHYGQGGTGIIDGKEMF